MTYYESAKGHTITRERAIQEITKDYTEDAHDDLISDFTEYMGEKKTYNAQKVLQFLGY